MKIESKIRELLNWRFPDWEVDSFYTQYPHQLYENALEIVDIDSIPDGKTREFLDTLKEIIQEKLGRW